MFISQKTGINSVYDIEIKTKLREDGAYLLDLLCF